jgi:hypothetical protein
VTSRRQSPPQADAIPPVAKRRHTKGDHNTPATDEQQHSWPRQSTRSLSRAKGAAYPAPHHVTPSRVSERLGDSEPAQQALACPDAASTRRPRISHATQRDERFRAPGACVRAPLRSWSQIGPETDSAAAGTDPQFGLRLCAAARAWSMTEDTSKSIRAKGTIWL